CHHRDLHSFPTRRSSDLVAVSCRSSNRSWGPSAAAACCPARTKASPAPVRATGADVSVHGLNEKRKTPRRSLSGAFRFSDPPPRSEEHTSELQSQSNLVC